MVRHGSQVFRFTGLGSRRGAGIREVNEAVVRLDEMARQNAVPAEQGSTAAVRLTDQARCLSASLADYRLLPA